LDFILCCSFGKPVFVWVIWELVVKSAIISGNKQLNFIDPFYLFIVPNILSPNFYFMNIENQPTYNPFSSPTQPHKYATPSTNYSSQPNPYPDYH
jgi:hypothetical protein